MLYEFCAENFERVPAAIDAGAKRIELCDNLAVGGTTPSAGVISTTVSYAHEHDARVMCMIRPRGGDFHYNQDELRMMEMDLGLAVSAGVDGLVFGCRNADRGQPGAPVASCRVCGRPPDHPSRRRHFYGQPRYRGGGIERLRAPWHQDRAAGGVTRGAGI